MEAGDVALAGSHTCYWGGPQRGAHAVARVRVPGGPVEPVQLRRLLIEEDSCIRRIL